MPPFLNGTGAIRIHVQRRSGITALFTPPVGAAADRRAPWFDARSLGVVCCSGRRTRIVDALTSGVRWAVGSGTRDVNRMPEARLTTKQAPGVSRKRRRMNGAKTVLVAQAK